MVHPRCRRTWPKDCINTLYVSRPDNTNPRFNNPTYRRVDMPPKPAIIRTAARLTMAVDYLSYGQNLASVLV